MGGSCDFCQAGVSCKICNYQCSSHDLNVRHINRHEKLVFVTAGFNGSLVGNQKAFDTDDQKGFQRLLRWKTILANCAVECASYTTRDWSAITKLVAAIMNPCREGVQNVLSANWRPPKFGEARVLNREIRKYFTVFYHTEYQFPGIYGKRNFSD